MKRIQFAGIIRSVFAALFALTVLQGMTFAQSPILIEAESLTLNVPVAAVGEDPAASGGKFIHIVEGANVRNPEAEASGTFTVSQAGTYKLWVRMMGPHGNADAMYVGLDDNAWVRKFPSTTTVYEWLEVGEYPLAAGEHTIKVGHGEILARVDALYLAAPDAAPPAGFGLSVEAESFTLLTPAAAVGDDPAASGGKFVHITEGANSRNPEGGAQLTVNVPADGTYEVWMRMMGPAGDADAMYGAIDDQAWVRKFPSTTGVYEWLLVGTYELKAGSHTLKFAHGEIRARVDAMAIKSAAQ